VHALSPSATLTHACLPAGLPYKRGDTLFVTRMTDCPAGFWECRNKTGDVGFVDAADLAVDPFLIKQRALEEVSLLRTWGESCGS
jgi:hypothetical protein